MYSLPVFSITRIKIVYVLYGNTVTYKKKYMTHSLNFLQSIRHLISFTSRTHLRHHFPISSSEHNDSSSTPHTYVCCLPILQSPASTFYHLPPLLSIPIHLSSMLPPLVPPFLPSSIPLYPPPASSLLSSPLTQYGPLSEASSAILHRALIS